MEMEFIFKHFWIVFIVSTFVNGLMLKVRSKAYVKQNPALKEAYDKLIKGVLFYTNIPWIIIGVGQLTGLTNSMSDFFNPRTMNPAVLAFHSSLIILWVLGAYWIFLKGGADFLVRHPGLSVGFSEDITSANAIKLSWLLGTVGGAAAMTAMWIGLIPELS